MAGAVAAMKGVQNRLKKHETAKNAGNAAVAALAAEMEAERVAKVAQLRHDAFEADMERLSIGPAHNKVVRCCTHLRDAPWFSGSIIGVIFLAGALVGIQTYPIEPGSTLAVTCGIMDVCVLWIFVVEIVVKFIAEGKVPWNFFNNGWNVFDFAIVAVGFMPIGGGGAVTALRLLRLLRVLKLVKALPKLQILVIGLLKSLSSIGYVGALLILVFYLFAVLGMGFFGENDPVQFGELWITMLSLFRAATLEDWTDLMYIAMYGCENYGYTGMEHLCVKSVASGTLGAVYWVVFILLSSMMILNLFIGVIASSMQDAQNELEEEAADDALEGVDESLEKRLTEISDLMRKAASELDTFAREENKQIESRKAAWVEAKKAARKSVGGGMGSMLAALKTLKKDQDEAAAKQRTSIFSVGSNS